MFSKRSPRVTIHVIDDDWTALAMVPDFPMQHFS